MKKPKVCFLIDGSIINTHHGVRRYVLSMMSMLSANYKVDCYMIGAMVRNGVYAWQRVYFSGDYSRNNGFSENHCVGNSRSEILENLSSFLTSAGSRRAGELEEIPSVYVGERIAEEYDACVVSAPWVLRPGLGLPAARKTFCIAYDAIPNLYSLQRPGDTGLRDFAAEHAAGYILADRQLDGILAISSDAKHQCERLGFGGKSPITVIPPFLPVGFENLEPAATRVRKQVILAAPFDERKGLGRMAGLLNGSGAESLVIFGGVRCDHSQLRRFFSELCLERVDWWSEVDYAKQVELYRSSELLLFPSLHEGLGLPVLEAYACGASVLVSDIRPLNTLAQRADVLPDLESEGATKIASRLSVGADPNVVEMANRRWGKHSLEGLFARMLTPAAHSCFGPVSGDVSNKVSS